MRSSIALAVTTLLLAGVAVSGWLLSQRSSALAGGIKQVAEVGGLRVTLRLDDAALGDRIADILIQDAADQFVSASAVRLRLRMAEMDMGATEFIAQPVGAGHFQTRGQFFTMAGGWSIEATVERDGQPPVLAPFTFAIGAPGEAGGSPNPLAVNGQVVQAGQQLYVANCAPCHGASGKGDGPAGAGLNPRPGDFTQHMVLGKHADGQVFLWIKNGYPNSAMPAWGERLTDEQIWQLVGYLRTFGQPATSASGSPAVQPTLQPAPPPALVPNVRQPLPPLIFARRSNIWRSDGTGGAPQPLTNFTDGSYAQYPTFSPDGSRIAFVAITPAPITATLPLPTSTLYVMNADGSAMQPIWQPKRGLIGLFTWAPDGQSMLVGANGIEADGPGSGRQLQIVRLDLSSGAVQPVLGDALDPVLSRDGKQLAYLKLSEDGYTMALHVAAPDGSGSHQLIAGADFQGFYAPRFTPNGRQIIVSGIGGPPTDRQGNPIKASAPSLLDRALGLFEPATVEAHGLPWDLWMVSVDGTGLRRLTSFYEDLPMATFSPDGTQVAVMGLGGIYLMDVDGGNLRRIDAAGDHGGLDWSRP